MDQAPLLFRRKLHLRFLQGDELQKPPEKIAERAAAVLLQGGGGKAVPLRRLVKSAEFGGDVVSVQRTGMGSGERRPDGSPPGLEKPLPLGFHPGVGGDPSKGLTERRYLIQEPREIAARRQGVEDLLSLQAGCRFRRHPGDREAYLVQGHFHEKLFQERGAEHGIAPAVNVTVGEGEAPGGAPDRQEKEERLFLSLLLRRAEWASTAGFPEEELVVVLEKGMTVVPDGADPFVEAPHEEMSEVEPPGIVEIQDAHPGAPFAGQKGAVHPLPEQRDEVGTGEALVGQAEGPDVPFQVLQYLPEQGDGRSVPLQRPRIGGCDAAPVDEMPLDEPLQEFGEFPERLLPL